MQINSGDIFGPSVNRQEYEIMEYLSRGGQAYIFTCKRLADAKQFAIKIFNYKPSIREKNLYQQFETWYNKESKEFKYCVNVRDIIDGHFYALIMDQAISDLNDMKIHDPIQVCIIMKQVILGIKELHERRIVHRDLKPENILLYKENQIQCFQITDFGISKFILDDNSTSVTGGIGSINYAAPEYLKYQESQIVDQYKTDLWQYGAVFYEKLYNKILFVGNTRKEIEQKIINFNPDQFQQLNRLDKPQRLRQLLKQLLCSPEMRLFDSNNISSILDTEIDSRLINIHDDLQIEQLRFLELKLVKTTSISYEQGLIIQFQNKYNKRIYSERKQDIVKDRFEMEYQISLIQVDSQEQIEYLSKLQVSVLIPHNYLINVFIFLEFKSHVQIFSRLFHGQENSEKYQHTLQLFQGKSYQIRLEILYQIIYSFWENKLLIQDIWLTFQLPSISFTQEQYQKYEISHPERIIKSLIIFLFSKEIFLDKQHQFLFKMLTDKEYDLDKSLQAITRRRKCLAHYRTDLYYLEKIEDTNNPNIHLIDKAYHIVLQTATSKILQHEIFYTSGRGEEALNQPNFRYYIETAQTFQNIDFNMQEEVLEFVIILVRLCRYLQTQQLKLGSIDQYSVVKVKNSQYRYEYKTFQSNCMECSIQTDQQYIVKLNKMVRSIKQVKADTQVIQLLRQTDQNLDDLYTSLQSLRSEFDSYADYSESVDDSVHMTQPLSQPPLLKVAESPDYEQKRWNLVVQSEEDFIKPRFLEPVNNQDIFDLSSNVDKDRPQIDSEAVLSPVPISLMNHQQDFAQQQLPSVSFYQSAVKFHNNSNQQQISSKQNTHQTYGQFQTTPEVQQSMAESIVHNIYQFINKELFYD